MRYLPRTQAPLLNILFTQWDIGRSYVPKILPFDPDASEYEVAIIPQHCKMSNSANHQKLSRIKIDYTRIVTKNAIYMNQKGPGCLICKTPGRAWSLLWHSLN